MFKLNKYLRFLVVGFGVVASISAIGQEYASMYMDYTSPGNLTCTSGTWTTVGTTNAFSSGGTLSSTWSFINPYLKVSTDGGGDYLVLFSLSFAADQGNWDVGISINDAAPTIIYQQRYIGNSNKEVGNISGMGVLAIPNDATVKLKVKQTSGGSLNANPYKAQVALVKLTDVSPDFYTEMKLTGNTTPLPVTSTYVKQTGFTQGQNSDWSFANSVLTAGANSAGNYLVVMSASAKVTSSAQPYRFGVSVDGASPSKILTRRYFFNNSDYGNVFACGIIPVVASATTLQLQANGPTSGSVIIENASVAVYKIAGTTPSTFGGMYVNDNATATTVNAKDTWYQATAGMTAMIANSFTHSSGTLTPTGLSAGTYLANYSCSLLGGSATATKVFTSVFVGGNEQSNLTTIRTLNSTTSPGAIGGTGLITIATPSDAVTLRLKNGTNTDNITVKYADLTLNRITYTGDASLPVELTGFNLSNTARGVSVAWETESEFENLGFILERRERNKTDSWQKLSDFQTNPDLRGAGTSPERHSYQYLDEMVNDGGSYSYRLADVDYQGKMTWYPPSEITRTSPDAVGIVRHLILGRAYPNPFNPSVQIAFELAASTPVRVSIFDLRGGLIDIPLNEPRQAGHHTVEWRGHSANGSPLETGLYFAIIETRTNTQVLKLLFLK